MIHDSIDNAHAYDAMHPNFRSVFNILQAMNLNALQPGHIELDGNYVFINVDVINGKSMSDARLEAHRRYIDIQMPISGAETFGWRAADKCMDAVAPFDVERDIVFFNDKPDEFISLNPGEFVIFFPDDAHAPCITDNSKHKKLVVKVSVEPNNEKPTL